MLSTFLTPSDFMISPGCGELEHSAGFVEETEGDPAPFGGSLTDD